MNISKAGMLWFSWINGQNKTVQEFRLDLAIFEAEIH
jgi:hypothetical protein